LNRAPTDYDFSACQWSRNQEAWECSVWRRFYDAREANLSLPSTLGRDFATAANLLRMPHHAPPIDTISDINVSQKVIG
jgi:hypothetical protein